MPFVPSRLLYTPLMVMREAKERLPVRPPTADDAQPFPHLADLVFSLAR